jgi:ParB family transcriptional regulator, chromosome partitioning protein
MTTSSSAAAHSGEKDKAAERPIEKRRALGRGLESLLPGPRPVPRAPSNPPTPGPAAAGGQQVPHRAAGPVRNDSAPVAAREENQAVAADGAAELRSAGQPGAAVPTDALAEGISIMAQAEPRAGVPAPHGNLVIQIALTDIDKNPFQTRYVRNNEALAELANSIKTSGVVQPIVVRPAAEEGRYILVLGERRLHASKLAGRETIPAIVRRVSEQQAAEMTIIENLQRQDLSALEQAESFRVLSEEFKLTQSQIGERIGLSRESVANYMRLLRLPESTMQLLAEGSISFAVAKELLKLDDKDQIAKAATHIVEKKLSFDQVERLVWQLMGIPTGEGPEKKGGGRWVDPNVRAAQTELERLLGMKVRIRDRKGKGKIVIEYATVDDYERVLEALRGKG